ncbi:MAG TPA: hypothetical protein VFM53_13130, partial [Anaeromyxobacteraceae bacterium]|nr:hypothetical protein [Anaeromyxobacteraceae bacterium]
TTPATLATLTVQPDPTSNFLGWAGACSGPGACTVAVDGTTSVEASLELAAAGGTMVDAVGGTVTSPTGVTIDVPPSAVDTPSVISVEVAVAPPPVPTDVAPESPIYEFKPHGKIFATPLEVSLPVNEGTLNACLYWQKPNADEFECIGGELNNGHIKAKVSHFSAAFVGPASPAYTAQGTQFNTYLASEATVANVPDNLLDDTVTAWVPVGAGGFARFAGQGQLDGTFRIPNLPAGRPVMLQVGPDPTRFAFVVATSGSSLDTGRILNGLPGLTEVAAADPMPVQLDIQNLQPYQPGDEIDVMAPRADTWATGVEGPSFPGGATSLTVGNLKAARSWVAPMSVIDGTRMPVLVTQLSGATAPSGQYYRRLSRFGKVMGLDVGPSIPPAPVTVVMGEPSLLDEVSVNWDLPAFRSVVLTPCTGGGANFQVVGQPGPMTFGASPVEKKRPYLFTSFPLVGPAVSSGTMTFGAKDYAADAWTLMWQANFNCYQPLAMPGGGTINVGASWTLQGIYGGSGSVVSLQAPSISPPLDFQIDGRPLSQPQNGVSDTPVFTWSPPAVGVPDLYRVLVRHHPAGQPAGVIVAIMLTRDTLLAMPPGLLRKGEVYTATLNAFLGGYTLGRPERLTMPFDRVNQPGAWFTVAADSFRLGGTVSGVRTPGLVLASPGQPPLALDAGATGFTFAAALPPGAGYDVTVAQQPANQICTVANGTGTVGAADVSSVAVNCRTIEVTSGCGDLAEYAVGQRWSYWYNPGNAASTTMSTATTPAPYRGVRFIRAVTTAAYGFAMVHTSDSPVDATGFDELRFAVRALNPNALGWQGAFPVVVLQDVNGNRATWTPTANLMPTDGATWVPISVPLRGGAGWTLSGAVDLGTVVKVEVYSDTWDFGQLTIDVDGMSFEHAGAICP